MNETGTRNQPLRPELSARAWARVKARSALVGTLQEPGRSANQNSCPRSADRSGVGVGRRNP